MRIERLAIAVILAALALSVVAVFRVAMNQPEPVEKDWCRDQWGHSKPLEFCLNRDRQE